MVYDDNSDEEEDNISLRSEEDELLHENPSDYEEEAVDNESDFLEELPDEDDASYCTDSSFRSHDSTHGSTPGTFACKCNLEAFFKRTPKCYSFYLAHLGSKLHCSKWRLHS